MGRGMAGNEEPPRKESSLILVTDEPNEGSVFSATKVARLKERFHFSRMRHDAPACEFVEADFGTLKASVSDLGPGDDGRIRRECHVVAGDVISDFETVELRGSASDGSAFGSWTVDAQTIERIRLWSIGHGMTDRGPALSMRSTSRMDSDA